MGSKLNSTSAVGKLNLQKGVEKETRGSNGGGKVGLFGNKLLTSLRLVSKLCGGTAQKICDESNLHCIRRKNPYTSSKKSELQEPNVPVAKQLPEIQIQFGNVWNTDTEWIGGKLNLKHDCTRFWLQNPNGISVAQDFSEFRGDLEDVRDLNIDFLAMPETKLNSNNIFAKDRIHTLIDYHSPNSKLCLTSTKGYDNSICYQPGGVGALVMNKLAGRYAGMGYDTHGRYSWMKFCGKKRHLKVYTFYRVPQVNGKHVGDTTAYAQQFHSLNVKNVSRSDDSKVQEKKHCTCKKSEKSNCGRYM